MKIFLTIIAVLFVLLIAQNGFAQSSERRIDVVRGEEVHLYFSSTRDGQFILPREPVVVTFMVMYYDGTTENVTPEVAVDNEGPRYHITLTDYETNNTFIKQYLIIIDMPKFYGNDKLIEINLVEEAIGCNDDDGSHDDFKRHHEHSHPNEHHNNSNKPNDNRHITLFI